MTYHSRTILVLGGARSGKSRHAQALAEEKSPRRLFVATAQPFDDEMRERIARHREDRDASWRTVEAPLALPAAIRNHGDGTAVVLVDCLTLWVSNLLLAERDLEAAEAELVDAVMVASAPVILVSNEVGFGIVPENGLARQFRDAAGRLHQRLAARVDAVDLVVAGLPLRVKPATTP